MSKDIEISDVHISKDNVYGDKGTYCILPIYWFINILFNIVLCSHIDSVMRTVYFITATEFSQFVYNASRVLTTLCVLAGFYNRSCKLYYAVKHNKAIFRISQFLLVSDYVYAYVCVGLPICVGVLWGNSIELILTRLGALVPLVIIVYTIYASTILIIYQVKFKVIKEQENRDY